ncbi:MULTISPECIES: pyridoxamine 5'-phosphate oxidase family protein [Thermomonospora]|jgi:nitroimidazol reductase NimA-like FMN-containing flavoprotein (pyridoxamine 5'-phosphate oxidase superfamily)|uniref:Pyridoxamine 5'-phosphate oxidase-related FMN-binding protein n=1 Tax=Thermomonospora curvata (strain ATCC 19995 / DSM 43183 / JCM 3096 / KCTC 9072 / NBRC 15933 / NCIMB 10081 / Henssen B9) TaxID=471852 RepID=D1A3H1_THECD|nr:MULTISPECIES: pyridoxamine 5'-phosphate oxidase family protein [Thermomonospora]ACY96096.1 pyridoxamine 5'-phosphate oxidase-related FMN- binding protein [Thermomonospora curvata DSM 43183]PKK15953.1 MAG: pyridoxamine 5'-phosphate oxidase family protein [Thermomonospora sp. CIF 1]
MPYDSGGLEILDEDECRALLAKAPLGRIVFTQRALPAIQPVNFTVDNGDVIIRAAQGTKLAAAARNAIVAFEVDDFDEASRTGWSVVIVGPARVVSDPKEVARLQELPLRPWAPGRREHFIRIRPTLISGRRIPEHSAPPPS